MQAFLLNLSKKFLIFYFVVVLSFLAKNIFAEEALDPMSNQGLLLIEKEMIKLSDQQKKEVNKKTYRSLLLLENYFLKGGLTDRAMKIVHQMVRMRDGTKDLKKKAFLECEAWRVLDHDLKNYEDRELIEGLKGEKGFTTEDHILFRKFVSKKVSSCIDYISTDWHWKGPEYQDMSYDVKAFHAVKTVQSYLLLKQQH